MHYNRHLALPSFQQFQLLAIAWAHGGNKCFLFKQHGLLIHVWLWKALHVLKNMMLCSVSKLRELSI